MNPQPSVQDIIEFCREASAAITLIREDEKKQVNGAVPVTTADKVAHDILMRRLSSYGFPVISEENEAVVPETGFAWVIDPLDGTADFISGSTDWCVMVAFVRDREPVVGVVYAGDRGEFWHASKHGGAFHGTESGVKRISVSSASRPTEAKMVASVSHPSKETEAVRSALGARSIPVASIGIKFGLIAQGDAECYWTGAPLGEWDVCAPSIIVREAGGGVTDTTGAEIIFGTDQRRLTAGCVASNGILHPALLAAGRAGIVE